MLAYEINTMLKPTFLEQKKPFHINNTSFNLDGGRTVFDFWRWAYSDVFQNITRGYIAQFIIAWLVGADRLEPSNPFQAYDVQIPHGKRIEVKSTAWLQSWHVKKPKPMFVIEPARTWDEKKGFAKEKTFNADVYALCYHYWMEKQTADLFNLDQWKFWAFTQRELINILRGNKSITTERLEKTLRLKPLDVEKMRDTLLSS